MKRGLFLNKSRYHYNKSSFTDLQVIARHFKQFNSIGLDEGIQLAHNIITLLTKQPYPIRRNELLDVNTVFSKLLNVLIEDESENSEEWVDSFLSCCHKQSFSFPVHTLQNCLNSFEQKPNRYGLLRFISYGIDTSGKQLSSDTIIHFFSLLTSHILKETEDIHLYNLLLCCSSICHCSHFAAIKSANLPELTRLSTFCFNTIQTLPHTTLQMKIHSFCLHILSICIQHHAYHHQSSPLLSHITSVYLPTLHPSEELTKYIGNCIQFLRLSHQSVPNELDTLTDIQYLLSWICEWQGEVSVIHEALSSVRVLFKELDKEWMEINETFTTSYLRFVQWSMATLQQEESVVNCTELLRTLQVCIKQTPNQMPSSFRTAYLQVFDLLLERVQSYQITSRYPVQDMVISLTQCVSLNAFNESPTWLLSRISSFPWESLTSIVYSPFFPLHIQKGVAQLLNKCLLQFSPAFSPSIKQAIHTCFKLSTISSLSVNNAICLGACLDGLALCVGSGLSSHLQVVPEDWIQAVHILLFHPSSSVKERTLQSLLNLPVGTLLGCSDLLVQSITEETSFTPSFDQKLRLFLKMGDAFSYPPSLLTHLLPILAASIFRQQDNTLIHTLQFLTLVADSIETILPPVEEWTVFILTRDEGVVREFVHFLTKVVRILGIEKIGTILEDLVKDDRLAKTEFFPFFVSVLQYHTMEELAGESFVRLLLLACDDLVNMKQLLQILHSFHERPALFNHHMNLIIERIEEYIESRKQFFSFLELVMTEETLMKCKKWTM